MPSDHPYEGTKMIRELRVMAQSRRRLQLYSIESDIVSVHGKRDMLGEARSMLA